MKTRNKLLIGVLCASLPLAGQAILVECDLGTGECEPSGNGFTVNGLVTRTEFYKVTLGVGEQIDYFHNGWELGVSQGSNFIVVDSAGVDQGWSIDTFTLIEPRTGYVDHGLIASSDEDAVGVLRWQGSSIGNGTFYFGYNTTQTDWITTGFLATDNSTTTLNEDWAQPVGQGLGPIHSPIPEPATFGLLAMMGGGLLWIRKCFMI